MAAHGFKEKHSNDNLYITDYNSLVSSLPGKYGEPKSQDALWSDKLFKDDPEDYGFAIAIGHAKGSHALFCVHFALIVTD